jgi:hypothetical protein
VGTEIRGLKRVNPKQRQRKYRDATMHTDGAGAVEIVKGGAARHDFSTAARTMWRG